MTLIGKHVSLRLAPFGVALATQSSGAWAPAPYWSEIVMVSPQHESYRGIFSCGGIGRVPNSETWGAG